MDISQLHERTSGVSSSNQNKMFIWIYEYIRNGWFLNLIERLYSTINNTLTIRYFVTIHFAVLITVELLSKSQFITNAQKFSIWIRAHSDTSEHGLSHTFKGPRAVDRHKNALMKCLFFFKLELNTLWFLNSTDKNTRVGTLIVAAIYLQLIQNRYMFRSFTVLQCSHQHCVQPVASDVEVVGYL